MKRVTAFILLSALGALVSATALGQSVGNYAPVVRTTGITYNSISGTGSSFASWRNGTGVDDNRTAATPIGFTFYYDGQAVNQFSISTNGYMDFSSSTANGSGTSAYGYENIQFTSTTGTLNAIAVFYDDLVAPAAGNTVNDNFKYLTTGSPGSQVLTVEWINRDRISTTTDASLNFQVKLYEATGVIEIIYGTMNAGSGATYSITCGLNGPTMSATPTVAELLTQQTVDTTTFSNTPANALATVPASNAMLTFTPPNVTPAAPINLTFTSVTASSMTVNWTDNSTDETGFSVLRSTDNVNFTVMGTVVSTTTGTTGTAYSQAQTGLTPGVTYYFQVTANTEGHGSTPLTGSQATNPPGSITSIASGNWGDTTTWSTGAVPAAFDNVTIADGHTVTINVAATCYELKVGQGTSGILQYEATAARKLTITQNALVTAGGTFQTAATGSVTTDSLLVGGNLTNDGTLDFSTNTNLVGARIIFTGAGNATFGGTGATTDLRFLTLNKGTSSASVLEMNPANLTVQGVNTDAPGGCVTFTNGTLKVAGTFTMTNRLFTAAAYSIGSTSGFWLANPNFTVAAQNGSPTITGLLRITSGTFNVGTAQGNSVGFSSGSNIIVEGGAINVSGRWGVSTSSNTITYNQSGGTLTLNTATGHSSATLASFDLGTSLTSSVTISGGTIILRNAGTATSGPRDYRNNAGIQNLGGGVLQLGDASSGTHRIYVLQGSVPELVLTNTSAPHTALLAAQTNVFGNTTIAANDSLRLNGFIFLQVGATVTNNGIIDGTVASSRLYFLGAGAAKIGQRGGSPRRWDRAPGRGDRRYPAACGRPDLHRGRLGGDPARWPLDRQPVRGDDRQRARREHHHAPRESLPRHAHQFEQGDARERRHDRRRHPDRRCGHHQRRRQL